MCAGDDPRLGRERFAFQRFSDIDVDDELEESHGGCLHHDSHDAVDRGRGKPGPEVASRIGWAPPAAEG